MECALHFLDEVNSQVFLLVGVHEVVFIFILLRRPGQMPETQEILEVKVELLNEAGDYEHLFVAVLKGLHHVLVKLEDLHSHRRSDFLGFKSSRTRLVLDFQAFDTVFSAEDHVTARVVLGFGELVRERVLVLVLIIEFVCKL